MQKINIQTSSTHDPVQADKVKKCRHLSRICSIGYSENIKSCNMKEKKAKFES